MPSWNQSFNAIILLSIAGFALVIASGFWHVLALLIIAAAVILLWRRRRR